MKKLLIILIIFVFFSSSVLPLYAYSQILDFLCEVGIKFYHQGRYEDAAAEFKKALTINPDYQPALKYIQMMEQGGVLKKEKNLVIPSTFEPAKTLDLIEIQKEMIRDNLIIEPGAVAYPAKATAAKETGPLKILALDDSFTNVAQPIEIEEGAIIVILGNNIQRFLVTEPNILTVEQGDSDRLIVTGKDIGYTYLHIWDDSGRWTTEWLGVIPEAQGPTYEELLRRQEELARNFKLLYTLDWTSYEAGRRIKTFERSSYSWSHSLSLNGPIPYGDIDSTIILTRSPFHTQITYATLGLVNGQLGPFEGFSLRGGDYAPAFTNLAFPGANLRGAIFNSPAFHNKLSYSTFWGREGGGRYSGFSTAVTKSRHSFLGGFNVDFNPTKKQDYKFSVVHGWGRDREQFLNRYGYDLSGIWNLDKWGLGYEIANDTERFAHLFNMHYTRPRFDFSTELRNIDSNFNSITAGGWSQGELGGLINLNLKPIDALWINGRLDVFRDRLYHAQDNSGRWNEDFNLDANYQLDLDTSFNLNYALQNELGRLSQFRYQSSGLGVSKKIRFIKDISTYLNYYHQESKSYSSPSADYINEKVYTGIRFSLVGELYYYLNREFNWVQERFYASRYEPNALETGVDWSSQIGSSPFYSNFRFTYRDEEDTVSHLSFLSGEDYIEGYSELTYRPAGDKEIYGSCRVRNIWADNPAVNKRIEADFNAGMRYLWDTGLHWDAVGSIEGYVFKDLNSDGLRQRDEPPLEGAKVWLGKDKFQVTDIFGYYKFKGVKARKAYVTLDTSTVPRGHVLTVPVSQEVTVSHLSTKRVDFGVISRSEISGLVFEDVDGNGEYGRGDLAVSGVVLNLEDGKESVTDTSGRYSFPNASVGEHTLSLQLNSVPAFYLPQVPITKKIRLFEGITYYYNIPLKRVKE